jgi:ferritin-like metal-binding protein YciE
MKIHTLEDMFLHTLKDIHYAEVKILKSLPKMIEAANDVGLKEALVAHKDETEGQIERIKGVFAMLEKRPSAVECEAINGIIEEAEGIIEDTEGSDMRDAAVIASGQAVEHYEIVRYRSLVQWADELNMPEASNLLKQSLLEEEAADEKLVSLASTGLAASSHGSGAMMSGDGVPARNGKAVSEKRRSAA